jgi:hypothetical protein
LGRAFAAAGTASSGVLPKIGNAIAKFLFQFASVALGGYRPELHYMRGPGPAWRAKHGEPQDLPRQD